MNKNTEKWNAFVLSILALALAVFAWGLGSKLSLYRTAGPAENHVPVAKLLSNRERPADAAIQIEHATTPLLTVVFAAFTIGAGFFLTIEPERRSIWKVQRIQNPQRRITPQATQQIFFRPPPSRL
ncbi:MAG: hypothetical protein WAM66_14515 [Acidobacteriaceae bacterium]